VVVVLCWAEAGVGVTTVVVEGAGGGVTTVVLLAGGGDVVVVVLLVVELESSAMAKLEPAITVHSVNKGRMGVFIPNQGASHVP